MELFILLRPLSQLVVLSINTFLLLTQVHDKIQKILISFFWIKYFFKTSIIWLIYDNYVFTSDWCNNLTIFYNYKWVEISKKQNFMRSK